MVHTAVWRMPLAFPRSSCSLRNAYSPWTGRKCCGFTNLNTSSCTKNQPQHCDVIHYLKSCGSLFTQKQFPCCLNVMSKSLLYLQVTTLQSLLIYPNFAKPRVSNGSCPWHSLVQNRWTCSLMWHRTRVWRHCRKARCKSWRTSLYKY